MKAFLCIFLFLGLLAKAQSLTCTLCLNNDKTCLNTTTQVCKPHENACISGVTEYIEARSLQVAHEVRNREKSPSFLSGSKELPGLFFPTDGQPKFVSYKSCLPSKNCHAGYSSVTVKKGSYGQSKAICCKKDKCNDVTVRLPPKNSSPNGLKCPSCFAKGSDHCHSKTTVRCTGKETHCIRFANTVIVGGVRNSCALQGCATKVACAVRTGTLVLADGQYISNITQIDCSRASPSRPQTGLMTDSWYQQKNPSMNLDSEAAL
ncbi:phospholipase A2 inhibitor and Ly6/PLAUR domain-containing protein [Varanus komodoensis]|nr:phospholipase A2 inhibitor and Ly6/PLAUR domain-containing protein [Varanus komodoensis]